MLIPVPAANKCTEIKSKPQLSSFKTALRPPRDSLTERFYYGKRWPSIHHSRLRIGCSKLNSHLYYNLHVLPSPACACTYHNEDPTHFFFHCPNYNIERITLREMVSAICDFNIDNLLFGIAEGTLDENHRLFDAVHTYICNTNRFS